jgi:predicted nucleic acid-binding protein
MPKVVVNTTPLIALANICKLDLLKQLYGEIYIPNGFYIASDIRQMVLEEAGEL